MRILCEYHQGGSSFVRTGWKNVFEACGHQFFWLHEGQAVLDVFNEVEPDVFLGCTYTVTRAHRKAFAARLNLKVGLFASAWGPLVDNLDREKYPIVIASEDEKRTIARLKEEVGFPHFVFVHVTDGEFLEGTLGGWRSIGVEPIGVLNACDTFAFLGGTPRPELACSVGYVGGFWPFKARNLERFILPLCHPSSGLDVKIFGSHGWPVAQWLGPCSVEDNRDLTVSATVCPNVSEPHSTDLGWDFVERPYRVMGGGGFCVSDYVEEGRRLFSEDELVMARTPKEFEETIRHFVRYPEDRLPYIEKGRKAVLSHHTYFDRVAKLLNGFGLEVEAEGVRLVKQGRVYG